MSEQQRGIGSVLAVGHRERMTELADRLREHATRPEVAMRIAANESDVETETRAAFVDAVDVLGVSLDDLRGLAWHIGHGGRGTREELASDLARHYTRAWLVEGHSGDVPRAASVRAALRNAGLPGVWESCTSGRQRTWLRLPWLDDEDAREEQCRRVVAALRRHFVEHGGVEHDAPDYMHRVHRLHSATVVIDRRREL